MRLPRCDDAIAPVTLPSHVTRHAHIKLPSHFSLNCNSPPPPPFPYSFPSFLFSHPAFAAGSAHGTSTTTNRFSLVKQAMKLAKFTIICRSFQIFHFKNPKQSISKHSTMLLARQAASKFPVIFPLCPPSTISPLLGNFILDEDSSCILFQFYFCAIFLRNIAAEPCLITASHSGPLRCRTCK